MEENDSADKIKGLSEFIEWVDNYCSEHHVPDPQFNGSDSFILQMDYTALLDLSAEECFANAICLMNYASVLQKKADTLNGHLSWCIEALDYLFSQQWDNYSGKFTPKEVVKKSIIQGNSYAQELEKCRLRLKSVYDITIEQCKDIKKRVNLLQDLGKKRNFS